MNQIWVGEPGPSREVASKRLRSDIRGSNADDEVGFDRALDEPIIIADNRTEAKIATYDFPD
jgi:hypothetical protein